MNKPKIQIVIGSTRENRVGDKVGKWFYKHASKREDAVFELVDLRDWPLPFYDEVTGPGYLKGNYKTPKAKEWAAKVAEADGYVIVHPEYNHGYSAVLKNALDYAYTEWNNKPVAFVSYGGGAAGARATEQLREVAVELQMAPIREAIHIPMIWEALDENGEPKNPVFTERIDPVLNQLLWWVKPLKLAREGQLPD
ncbi:MAG: NAD(P)H-dependent oxidoreductase [Patescibacteria group bacterium]